MLYGEILISIHIRHPCLIFCVLKVGKSFQIKESEGWWKETDFWCLGCRAFYSFLFSRSKFSGVWQEQHCQCWLLALPRGCLSAGLGVVVRRVGLEGRQGWLRCFSVTSWCPNRTQHGLEKPWAGFQCPCCLPDRYREHSFNMWSQDLTVPTFYHFVLNSLKPRSLGQEKLQIIHGCKHWAPWASLQLNEGSKST